MRGTRRCILALVRGCIVSCAILTAAVALADGGTVRLKERSGPFVITVFTSPTPLRAGPADVSVLLQEAASDRPILDATVVIALRPLDDHRPPIRVPATHRDATNKLLYAALVDVPVAGVWGLHVTVRHGDVSAEVTCPLDVAPPAAPLRSYWLYLALPPLVAALFALHQWLGARAARRRAVA